MLPCVPLYEELVNSERGIHQCFCSNIYIYILQISFVEEKREVCVVLFSSIDVKPFAMPMRNIVSSLYLYDNLCHV
jgi:hypothetical protein